MYVYGIRGIARPRLVSLQWIHNERDGVSNHQPHDCLLSRLFRHRSRKTSKHCVSGLCEGKSPVTGEFPAQRASNVENISIWWRHHVINYISNRTQSANYHECVLNSETLKCLVPKVPLRVLYSSWFTSMTCFLFPLCLCQHFLQMMQTCFVLDNWNPDDMLQEMYIDMGNLFQGESKSHYTEKKQSSCYLQQCISQDLWAISI